MKNQTAPLISAIATIAAVGIGLSITVPLIAMRMEAAGYSGNANGIGTAMSGFATFFAAPFTPALVRTMGAQRAVLLALVLGVITLFALATVDTIAWWTPLRFLFGIALTILFVVSEYTISALAPEGRRGFWIGLYSTSLGLAFAFGPVILAITGAGGKTAYLIAIALFILASLPVAIIGANPQPATNHASASLTTMLMRAPSIMLAALVFGAVETSLAGLLPVFALRNGYDGQTGALFVSLASLGSVLFQIPLGLSADRLNHRTLLAAITAAGFTGALLLPALAGIPWAFGIVLLLWGGITGSLYMVGLSELGVLYQNGELASANAAYVMFYAGGMLLGPPLLGQALDWSSHYGLFGGLALIFACYLLSIIILTNKQPDKPHS